MDLGGRAALSVPLIAFLIGMVTALFSMATEADNALITGWDLARITFAYAVIIALPIGIVLSFPAVLFGRFLPKPRFAWLVGIGTVAGGMPVLLMGILNGGFDFDVINGAALFGVLGAFAATLWWHFVERHRVMDEASD
ncbi:MAG: hypothetical protein C0471_09810 [Erythrobacter sp.]|nr:hypothetical protein [Erythrobacter sp.]